LIWIRLSSADCHFLDASRQCHRPGDWRQIEVAAVDPVASMKAIQNLALEAIAVKVREELEGAIEAI